MQKRKLTFWEKRKCEAEKWWQEHRAYLLRGMFVFGVGAFQGISIMCIPAVVMILSASVKENFVASVWSEYRAMMGVYIFSGIVLPILGKSLEGMGEKGKKRERIVVKAKRKIRKEYSWIGKVPIGVAMLLSAVYCFDALRELLVVLKK